MGERRGCTRAGRAGVTVLAVACLALITAGGAAASGAASTFTVSGFGDGTGSCTAPDPNGNSVCTTLRAAVVEASKQANTPTINLQAGTFQLTAGNGGQLDLATSMNIVGAGPGGPSGTTIQQTDGQNRVLEVNGAAALSGLKVTGGHLAPTWTANATELGGGILAQGKLILQNVLLTGNQVAAPGGSSPGEAGDGAEGGGIDYAAASAAGSQISDSTISGNRTVGGGGATGGTSAGGSAEGGGIAYEGTGPLVVQNSTIAQNSATGGAGGPAAAGGGKGGNGLGGGIFSENSSDLIVNSTVFGNGAQGGPPALGGSPGDAYGGGIFAEGSGVSTTLQSDTLDANTSSFVGGNIGSATAYPFAIHDTILTGGSPTNCGLASPVSSESYNLEDDAADSCGFAAADHDLVGVSPQLAPALGDNGGPTQTLAPATTSPILRAGGTCLDPTSTPPNQPLTADQRGEPRATPCDIGAFQAQSPKNIVRPAVSGTASRGHRLVCSEGSWSGDGGPFAYAFAWLRNGLAIPGATSDAYAIGSADPGQSLACRVTATYYGSVAATSPFVVVTSYPVVTILKVSESPSTLAVTLGCRGVDGQRCTGMLRLTVVEKLRRSKVIAVTASQPQTRKRTVIVGQHRYSLLARHTETVRIALRTNGSRLLRQFRGLPVKLTVTQSTAAGTAAAASRSLKIPVHQRRRRA